MSTLNLIKGSLPDGGEALTSSPRKSQPLTDLKPYNRHATVATSVPTAAKGSTHIIDTQQPLPSAPERLAGTHESTSTEQYARHKRQVADTSHSSSPAATSPYTSLAQRVAFLQRIDSLTQSAKWQVVGVVLTLYSLFIHDLSVVCFPKEGDLTIAVSLLVLFIVFATECVFACLTRRSYIRSLHCLFDVLGTLSLLLDIYFISDPLFQTQLHTSKTVNLTASDSESATSTYHATDAVAYLRFFRVTRMLRLLRLLRLARLVRLSQSLHSRRRQLHNRIGLALTDLVDRRLVGMMLGLLIVAPPLLVQTSGADDVDNAHLLALHSIIDSSTANATQTQQRQHIVIQQYLAQQPDKSLLLLRVYESTSQQLVTYRDSTQQYLSSLRAVELIHYTSFTQSSLRLEALQSVRREAFTDALSTLLLTLFVVVLFGLTALAAGRTIQSLIVAPLDAMSTVLSKLAGTVCFLAAPQNDAQHSETMSETEVIESICARLAMIFNVQSDGTATAVDSVISNSTLTELNQTNDNQSGRHNRLASHSKAMSLITGSRETHILSAQSIVTVRVSEAPRELTVNEITVHQLRDAEQVRKSAEWRDFGANEMRSKCKDFASVETVLSNPAVKAHMQLALMAQHQLKGDLSALFMNESDLNDSSSADQISPKPRVVPRLSLPLLNADGSSSSPSAPATPLDLLICFEIRRYRSIVLHHAGSLYQSFISPSGVQQINLPSHLISSCASALQLSACHSSMFDECQLETIRLMSSHWQGFINSKFARAYADKRMQQLVARGKIVQAHNGRYVVKQAQAQIQNNATATTSTSTIRSKQKPTNARGLR